MSKGLSARGGEVWSFLKSELNTAQADNLSCAKCSKPIPLLQKDNKLDRRNRRDCEDDSGLLTYHLVCYDLLLFGKVTDVTNRIATQLTEIYGEI